MNNLRKSIKYCDCLIKYQTNDKTNTISKIGDLFVHRYILQKSKYFSTLFEVVNPTVMIIDKSIYNTYNLTLPFTEDSLFRCIDVLYDKEIENFNNIDDLLIASLHLRLSDEYIKNILRNIFCEDFSTNVLYPLVIDICESQINDQIKSGFLSRILFKLTDVQISDIKQKYLFFPDKYYSGKTFVDDKSNRIVLSQDSSIIHNGIKYETYLTISRENINQHGIWLKASPVDENNYKEDDYKTIKLTMFKDFELVRHHRIISYNRNRKKVEKDGKLKIPCPLNKYSFVTNEQQRYGCMFDIIYPITYEYEIEITD